VRDNGRKDVIVTDAKLTIAEILCELVRDNSEQSFAENCGIAEGFLQDFMKLHKGESK
jgi:hypothetical protein